MILKVYRYPSISSYNNCKVCTKLQERNCPFVTNLHSLGSMAARSKVQRAHLLSRLSKSRALNFGARDLTKANFPKPE